MGISAEQIGSIHGTIAAISDLFNFVRHTIGELLLKRRQEYFFKQKTEKK
jgi:hypothetical protein